MSYVQPHPRSTRPFWKKQPSSTTQGSWDPKHSWFWPWAPSVRGSRSVLKAYLQVNSRLPWRKVLGCIGTQCISKVFHRRKRTGKEGSLAEKNTGLVVGKCWNMDVDSCYLRPALMKTGAVSSKSTEHNVYRLAIRKGAKSKTHFEILKNQLWKASSDDFNMAILVRDQLYICFPKNFPIIFCHDSRIPRFQFEIPLLTKQKATTNCEPRAACVISPVLWISLVFFAQTVGVSNKGLGSASAWVPCWHWNSQLWFPSRWAADRSVWYGTWF